MEDSMVPLESPGDQTYPGEPRSLVVERLSCNGQDTPAWKELSIEGD